MERLQRTIEKHMVPIRKQKSQPRKHKLANKYQTNQKYSFKKRAKLS